MILDLLILCSVVVIAAGGRSPHADYVEELARANAFGSRISDNVMEDATLDLPSLVNKYNYPFQEHSVITQDGYILRMHRIPHGRDANNAPGDRPVVFVMHGLFSSSADHVVMGPGTAMAYILAEEGYDVWMGNARGNYFSRRHILLNPDALFNSDFWEFSWDEIGFYDLPAMIDYILRITGRSGLHYIGHSQGTTAFFVMASRRPEYNGKIISMQALAPVAYMAYNRNRIFLRLAPHARELAELATTLGLGEVFPRNDIFSWAGQTFCRHGAISQPLCSAIVFLVFGWNVEEHNATMLPVNLGHAPSGAALRQLAHYGQSITEKEFRRYDFGILRNLVEYGSAFPPRYDLSRITAPVFLHYSENDLFAHVNDVDRLHRELGNSVGMFVVPQPTFSHLDFIWGNNAKSLLFDRVISFMRLMGNL